MRPQSTTAKASHLRGGKRKCRRCKVAFMKPSGTLEKICPRCKLHCSRCDVPLSEKNRDKFGKTRNRYRCKKCTSECVKNSRGKSGFKQRDYDLLRNYGITVNEYESILADQNGVCWICGRSPTGNRLAVDHKHEKGERRRDPREKRSRVRGLLCWGCNAAIGKFKDDPIKLRKAADYVEQCPAQKILGGGNVEVTMVHSEPTPVEVTNAKTS